MKKIIITLIGCLATALSVAQESGFTKKADSIIAPLDKTQITTGILYDRVFPTARLDVFNLYGSSDTTSNDHWLQTYFELYNASFNKSGWLRPSYFSDTVLRSYTFQNVVPIGILDYNYNMMDTLAVQNNLFTYTNGILYDVPGRSSSPY